MPYAYAIVRGIKCLCAEKRKGKGGNGLGGLSGPPPLSNVLVCTPEGRRIGTMKNIANPHPTPREGTLRARGDPSSLRRGRSKGFARGGGDASPIDCRRLTYQTVPCTFCGGGKKVRWTRDEKHLVKLEPPIAKVFCLWRGQAGMHNIAERNHARGTSPETWSDEVLLDFL